MQLRLSCVVCVCDLQFISSLRRINLIRSSKLWTAPKETVTPEPDGRDSIHKSAPPQKDIAASVRHLSKAFGESSVLEDVSFDVAEGESLVLLGASGSGKTTILRIVAGLDQPDKGRVVSSRQRCD